MTKAENFDVQIRNEFEVFRKTDERELPLHPFSAPKIHKAGKSTRQSFGKGFIFDKGFIFKPKPKMIDVLFPIQFAVKAEQPDGRPITPAKHNTHTCADVRACTSHT